MASQEKRTGLIARNNTQARRYAMTIGVNRIIHQLRGQIPEFCDRVTQGLSSPKARFVQQMIYGIQASKDVKLSQIGRTIEETIPLKKTVERLSHHLKDATLRQRLSIPET